MPVNPQQQFDSEFEHLLTLQIDGELSSSDADRLAALLQADAQKREYYVRYIALHAWLDWDRADVVIASPKESRVRLLLARAIQFVVRPTPLSWTIAALFMVALVTAMAFTVAPAYRELTQQPSASDQVVAQLHGLHETIWAEGQVDAKEGAHLLAGKQLELKSGLAEVVFRSGARVVLEGPVVFKPLTTNQGSLIQGKLAARIEKPAKGFSIQTPRSTVTDLGTEFAVEVQANGSEQVHVIEGVVVVRWGAGASATGDVTRLSAGEALHLDGSPSAKPQALPSSPNRFVTRLPLPKPLASWTFDDDLATQPEVSLHGGAALHGGRLLLNGSDDFMVLYDRADRSLNVGSYTLCVWVRPTAPGAQNVLVRTNQDGPDVSFSHQLWIDGESRFGHYTFDGRAQWLIAPSPVQLGQWHHVALTAASNGAMNLYVDGRRQAHTSGPLRNLWMGGDRFQLGGPAAERKPRQPLSGVQGELSNLAIYDVVLSATAIAQLARELPE